ADQRLRSRFRCLGTRQWAWRPARQHPHPALRASLLGDHDAFGGVGMIFAHEGIAAGLERMEPPDPAPPAVNHLLDAERIRIEFLRRRILIVHIDDRGLTGFDMDLGRIEFMILHRQIDRCRRVGGAMRSPTIYGAFASTALKRSSSDCDAASLCDAARSFTSCATYSRKPRL